MAAGCAGGASASSSDDVKPEMLELGAPSPAAILDAGLALAFVRLVEFAFGSRLGSVLLGMRAAFYQRSLC